MPKCSVLIASLRPDALEECVKSIEDNTKDYELLVDTEPGGIYKGINRMFEVARGEYIVHIPDDCVALPGWMRIIEFMKDVELGAFRIKLEEYSDPPLSSYFGVKFAPFFCIGREYAKKIGGIFDTRFNSFYGDPDLGLRVYADGGRMRMCDTACVLSKNRKDKVHEESVNMFEGRDKEEFYKKWRHLGN